MSSNNKVIWTEGMFLQPAHFQQQDRYFQHWLEIRCGSLQIYPFGVTQLEINQEELGLGKGKFALTHCQGAFSDGTPFSIPNHHPAPIPIDIPTDTKDQIVYLCLPMNQISNKEVVWTEQDDELSRYRMQEISVKDCHSQFSQDATVQSGSLWTRLRLSNQNQGAYVTVAIARIKECKPDKTVILDNEFIPTCLHVNASPLLLAYIKEIAGLLHQRGETLAGRLGTPGASGVAEIRDFLFLQIINRYEPLFNHLTSITQLHPEQLFNTLIQMVGELSTITEPTHRFKELPVYQHENQGNSFNLVIFALREALNWVPEARAIPIPLEERPYQIRIGAIYDRTLLQSAEFVLAAKAELSTETIRTNLPRQTTIATKEKLSDYVNAHVLGIRLTPLPVAPRQLPFHNGMIYFGLDKNHALWQELEKSGTIAMHFSGEYPGLELEFWAIRR
jgi:type VI secretion system protein ImpJ